MDNLGVKNALYFLLIFIIDLNRLGELNTLLILIGLQEGNVERRIDPAIALEQFQFIDIFALNSNHSK
jgi:hypothetical protein